MEREAPDHATVNGQTHLNEEDRLSTREPDDADDEAEPQSADNNYVITTEPEQKTKKKNKSRSKAKYKKGLVSPLPLMTFGIPTLF